MVSLIIASVFSLAGGFGQTGASIPDGLVGWWKAENNAVDAIGTNHGIITGQLGYAPCMVGQGFLFHGGTNDGVWIPASVTLDVGLGAGFTVEAWITPSDTAGAPIVEWMGTHIGEPYGSHILQGLAAPGYLYANIVDIEGRYHIMDSQRAVLSAGVPSHIAVTYDKLSGTGRIYVDGAKVSESNLGTFTPQTSYNLNIGFRPPNVPYGPTSYLGMIDEVSIYGRALDDEEILSIFQAGTSGKTASPVVVIPPQSQVGIWGKSVSFSVSAKGDVPLYYQWYKDRTMIPGATNDTLVLNSLTSVDAACYSVEVSNVLGVAISSEAFLTVNPAGVSLGLYAGVTIEGVVGFTYGIQTSTNMSSTNSWQGLVNVTLSSPQQLWIDVQPANSSHRYYRVIPGPITIP